jgi:hypothetical protein
MLKTKTSSGPSFLNFALMYPSGQLRYYRYNVATGANLEEIAEENGRPITSALKALAQKPPHDPFDATGTQ